MVFVLRPCPEVEHQVAHRNDDPCVQLLPPGKGSLVTEPSERQYRTNRHIFISSSCLERHWLSFVKFNLHWPVGSHLLTLPKKQRGVSGLDETT